MKDAVEIDRDHVAPEYGGYLGEGHADGSAGIVDENGDRPMRRPRSRECGIDLGAIGDIGGEATHVPRRRPGPSSSARLGPGLRRGTGGGCLLELFQAPTYKT